MDNLPDPTRIHAVTVNHNTSLFCELMLRSLFASHRANFPLSMTVMDNASTDDTTILQAYCQAQGIPFRQSGFTTEPGQPNTHGEILRAYILEHPDCTHYLFIDPDVWFLKQGTLNTMLTELERDTRAFGIAPRFSPEGEHENHMPSGNAHTGEAFILDATIKLAEQEDFPPRMQTRAVLQPRLHPFCALVKNTSSFRRVVESVGLSPALTVAVREGLFWDTFGLATAVMATHGQLALLSTAMVGHFFCVSYDEYRLEEKRKQCKEMLGNYR